MAESPAAGPGAEAHWDATYRDRGAVGASWYQPAPTISMALIRRLGISKDAAIVDIGGGASCLVDALLAEGFSNLSVLDISATALAIVRRRLEPGAPVSFIHEDLLAWTPGRRFDLWHDRAVFHFLVDQGARTRYRLTMRRSLPVGGWVILGTFAPDGPEYCSGLPVARYSAAELSEVIGPDFDVVDQSRQEHVTPAGTVQPFTWVAARRGRPSS